MARCLTLSPFPVVGTSHGGQARLASIIRGLRQAGWDVTASGIYPGRSFPVDERGADDLLLGDEIDELARTDMLFYDLHAARLGAMHRDTLDRLRLLVERVDPDVIHLEHPWPWLLLREVLTPTTRPAIVYSCPNIEWRLRQELFRFGLRRHGAEALVEATRLLEEDVANAADLVVAISDLEAAELERQLGKSVLYVPPVSDLADTEMAPGLNRFKTEAVKQGVTAYTALMGSRYWPNLEGFFDVFPHGLGFLPLDQQVWIAGNMCSALEEDPRYQDFFSTNASRTRFLGYLAEEDKAALFYAAASVIVPVRTGGGAKLKTADAIASGRPVVITPHALEGYGPLVRDAVGYGVYVTDTPSEFRALIRESMHGQLVGCHSEVRSRLRPSRLSETLDTAYRELLSRTYESR